MSKTKCKDCGKPFERESESQAICDACTQRRVEEGRRKVRGREGN